MVRESGYIVNSILRFVAIVPYSVSGCSGVVVLFATDVAPVYCFIFPGAKGLSTRLLGGYNVTVVGRAGLFEIPLLAFVSMLSVTSIGP